MGGYSANTQSQASMTGGGQGGGVDWADGNRRRKPVVAANMIRGSIHGISMPLILCQYRRVLFAHKTI